MLKPDDMLGILLGNTRIGRHHVPITHYALIVLLDVGFILKEEVIKIQRKVKTTRKIWSKLKDIDFFLIYHEELFILEKPRERDPELKYSMKLSFIELKI